MMGKQLAFSALIAAPHCVALQPQEEVAAYAHRAATTSKEDVITVSAAVQVRLTVGYTIVWFGVLLVRESRKASQTLIQQSAFDINYLLIGASSYRSIVDNPL